MLRAIRELIAEISGEDPPRTFAADDQRLAVAALLVHIVAIDGSVSESEREKLRQLLAQHYELSPADTEELIAEAKRKDDEAVDLYGFTSVLKRTLPEADRGEVIAMMWTMVYADGEASEFEDNIVWRVAELLGVPSRERIELKHEAKQRLGASEGEAVEE